MDGKPDPGPTPARAIAAYLTAVRALVNEASASRRVWVRQVGTLIQDARTKPPEMVAPPAGQIGTEQRHVFQALGDRLRQLSPPPECVTCHETVASWLDKQMAACDIMIEVGQTGDVTQLRATQGLLAEGRIDTQHFNAEYQFLVTSLRQRIDAASARRRPGKGARLWPFRRSPGSTTTRRP